MTNYDRFLSPMGRQLHESAIRRMGTVLAKAQDMVSFAAGYPDPTVFPWDDLRAIANELLTGTDGTVLQYGPTRGYRPLLEAILGVLDARGIKASLDELMITSGSQQGLDLVARVLISPGDVVLVELPTYTGAIAAFKNMQASLVGVKQDEDGINLEDLDEVLQRERAAGRTVKLLYLVPNFQNPTGLLLSLDKRRRLIEWAEKRDVLIIEDDPYGVLYFDDVATEAETRPIRADDDRRRVIYLSTFSKTLAPGFRVGWMVAPSALIERFDTAKQSVDLTSGILDQRIILEAVRRGVPRADCSAAPRSVSTKARRDGAGAPNRAGRSPHVAGAEGWVLPLGDAAGGAGRPVAPRACAGPAAGVRDRQRVLRGRQRPRQDPPLVLRAVPRANRRRCSSAGGGPAARPHQING